MPSASLNHVFCHCLPSSVGAAGVPGPVLIAQTKEGWSGGCGGPFRRLGRWLAERGLGTGLGDLSLALGGPVCAQWGWGTQGEMSSHQVYVACVVCV